MKYHSTRNKSTEYTSKEAIIKGLCDDGGLFVSDDIGKPVFDIEKLMDLTYNETALQVFKYFFSDFSEEELKDCIKNGYTGKFENDELSPLTEIGDNWLLELYHGPTAAFKDVALCMLPQLMSKANNGKKIMILTATSGDTGKAALAGFKDVDNIGITVFYPHEKVSHTQYLQMATSEGKNVYVAAVKGNFDDCQTGVKNIFRSRTAEFEKEYGVSLSSANSINIGRLVPQIVYYIEAYKTLLKKWVIEYGDKVDFCVPTGNFGDVLAGFYAKLLGLPVGKLIVASNENRVLYDFLTTGVYDKNREFVKTSSPSMDILVSSNLERMLYYYADGDTEYIKSLMDDLDKKGSFRVSKEMLSKIAETFDCGFCTDEDCKKAMDKAFKDEGRLIDPHTAVAYKVACELKKNGCSEGNEMVILSTASPFKFTDDMKKMSAESGEKIPAALFGIEKKPILHKEVVEIPGMDVFTEKCIVDLIRK